MINKLIYGQICKNYSLSQVFNIKHKKKSRPEKVEHNKVVLL